MIWNQPAKFHSFFSLSHTTKSPRFLPRNFITKDPPRASRVHEKTRSSTKLLVLPFSYSTLTRLFFRCSTLALGARGCLFLVTLSLQEIVSITKLAPPCPPSSPLLPPHPESHHWVVCLRRVIENTNSSQLRYINISRILCFEFYYGSMGSMWEISP